MDFIQNNLFVILIAFNYLLALTAVVTVILKKINPTKTLSYIIVLLVFPFIGLLVYYLFGQEYRKTKIFNRKHVLNQSVITKIQNTINIDHQSKQEIEELLEEKSKLIPLLNQNDQSKLTLNNDIEIIENGDKKINLLLKDIKNAKHHIHLEYFIIKDDVTGTEVLNELIEKSNEGIDIKIIVDDVGSSISSKMKKRIKHSGITMYRFMPVLFSRFTGKMNYRDHRKIIVIDGKIGYVGGINISDNYVNSRNQRFWRDTHIRVEGEAVLQLQILFFTTWDFVSEGDLKIDDTFFPEHQIKNKLSMQFAASGPDTDWANIMESIFVAITNAEDYIYLTTPYFIPNDEIVTALQVASRSNIEVKLIIPKNSDSWIAEHATNSYVEQLLKAGIEVYQYEKGFIHSKTMIVDSVFCSVGTANMDYRSFNINFEVNALIYDKETSGTLLSLFNKDLEGSHKIEIAQWSKRSIYAKLLEALARLMAPLL
ncbi:cardiolipin synthase [Winogradskyella sp. A2]|uniref:cardiolipin synthase n=1 Tax=Winogradskyella sp. A2 TaxID=3366944 RepID=UPI00398C6386